MYVLLRDQFVTAVWMSFIFTRPHPSFKSLLSFLILAQLFWAVFRESKIVTKQMLERDRKRKQEKNTHSSKWDNALTGCCARLGEIDGGDEAKSSEAEQEKEMRWERWCINIFMKRQGGWDKESALCNNIVWLEKWNDRENMVHCTLPTWITGIMSYKVLLVKLMRVQRRTGLVVSQNKNLLSLQWMFALFCTVTLDHWGKYSAAV